MKTLTVYYDPDCGVCRLARRWLGAQPTYVPLRFVPRDRVAASASALGDLVAAADDLIVAADTGEVWRGDSAFIMGLWATRRYRRLAIRLSRPALRPLARSAFGWVSGHRGGISRALGLDDAELRAVIERDTPPIARCCTIADVVQLAKQSATDAVPAEAAR